MNCCACVRWRSHYQQRTDMAKSKTQQAIDLMRENPGLTAYAAAAQVGVSEQAIYGAMKRTKDRQKCPCCGQVVREGFAINPAVLKDQEPN